MFNFKQRGVDFSQPTKEFERLVLSQKMQHDGNPVLGWCLANTRLEITAGTELVKPHKGKSTGRIDCVVAAIMALAGAMTSQNNAVSIYEDRDFLLSFMQPTTR